MDKILRLDVNDLSEFQKELHSSNSTDPDDVVYSRFTCVIEKYAWSIHDKVKMAYSILDDKDGYQVIYTASKKFDVLFKTEMSIPLLAIRVKDKYKSNVQICYPHNAGHNIPYQVEVRVDDDRYEGHDSIWLDIHSMFFMKPGAGMRDLYNRRIGNLPSLEEWTTQLPPRILTPPQVFSYCRNTRVGIKTLQSSMNTVTHHYKIRNKIQEVLRMRILNTKGEWEEIPCNMKFLYVKGRAKSFPVPELWGRYGLMTDEEREWFKLDRITKQPVHHISYIEDILSFTSVLSDANVENISIQTKVPCKALFWVAQNMKCLTINNFSNYTTNLENIQRGLNPCFEVSLKYGGDYRVKGLGSEHFDQSEPWDFFMSAPSEPGYNAYALGYDFNTIRNTDTGIILNPIQASLELKLTSDSNNYSDTEIDSDNETPEASTKETETQTEKEKFIVHVRALVCKKLEMKWDGLRLEYTITDDATNKNNSSTH